MRLPRLALLVSSLSLSLSLASCGSRTQVPTVLVEEGVPGQDDPAQGSRGTRSTEPKAKPLRGPGPLGPFIAPASALSTPNTSAAQPLADTEAEALRAPLTARVADEGGGMELDAGPVAGRFKEGDVLELAFVVKPGKCYMAVAVSTGGVSELEIRFVMTPPVPSMPLVVLAEDTTTGPHATLGGGQNCFKNPMPLSMPLVMRVKAVKGAGLSGAQVLSR